MFLLKSILAYSRFRSETDSFSVKVIPPEEAILGTLRHKYAETTRRNAVHGSDSPENAKKEIAFFF